MLAPALRRGLGTVSRPPVGLEEEVRKQTDRHRYEWSILTTSNKKLRTGLLALLLGAIGRMFFWA